MKGGIFDGQSEASRKCLEALGQEGAGEWPKRQEELSTPQEELRVAEEALAETNELLETILDHTHMLVAYLDPQFNFVRVNRAYAEADERDPSFFPGKNHFDLYPNTENEEIFRRVVETGEPYFAYAKPFEYAEHPGRGVTYWDWSLIPIKDPGEAVTGLVLTVVNVTERVQAEEQLRYHTVLLQTVSDAVISTDLNFKIMTWNKTAETMYGWQEDEVIGKRVDEVTRVEWLYDDEGDATQQLFEEGSWKGEIVQHHKDGARMNIQTSVSLIKNGAGNPIGVVAVNRDITKQVWARETLQELAHNLDERVKELDCLYGISRLVQRPGISLEEILQGTIDLIPAAWQYPDITCVRIVLEDQEFRTESFEESAWKQTADIIVHGECVGALEVYYLEERPESGEGPFLEEERSLLNAIVERLTTITEQKRGGELLREQNQFITTVFESLAHPFYVVDANDYTVKMANSAVCADEWPEPITCYALTHRRDTPCEGMDHLCPVEAIKKTGKPAVTEHVHYDREGGRRIYEAHGHPILDKEGNVSQIIEYTLDITDRVRAEEALRKANDELERQVEMRTATLERAIDELVDLRDAERHQRQWAETLASASLALTKTLNLDTVLNTLLDYLGRLVPYDSVAVILPQDEAHLAIRAVRGYELWADPQLILTMTIDAHASPPIQELLTTQKSILVPDTRQHPDWEHPAGVEHVLNWLGVPLIAGDKVIGLCGLDKTEPRFFTPRHLQLAEALVGQAAVAVQNAWLFEQVRDGRERLKSLSHRLVEVQEAERRYIARELHDEAGQALTSLMVGLRLLEREAKRPEAIIAGLAELKRRVDSVSENLHRLAMDLRPASLDHLGLVATLRQYAEAVSDKHGLVVQLETVGFENRLPLNVETALYRIVQEALTNVIRHARATRVDVLLKQHSDKLILIVEDNGVGFDPIAAMQSGRLGLPGMHERADMLGGTLVMESAAGAGTTLWVEVPYGDSDSHRG